MLARAAPLLAAAALALGACAAAPPEPPQPPNLVLVVVDALRADHLGVYGGPSGLTPRLDRFAAGAAAFERARTLAPCTFPSVNGLLTGRHPARFLDQPFGDLGIPAGVPTLPGALRRAGYRTAAVSASPVVRDSPGAINRAGGFGRGFDLFLEGCTWRDGRCVTRRAADLVALLPEPFFLYVHYLDPHDPYASPAATTPAATADLPQWVRAGDPLPAARRLYGGGGRGDIGSGGDRAPGALARSGLTPAGLAHLRRRYAEEVAFADAEVGRLLDVLDTAGLAARTAVVVTADHGESFLEHGHLRHCRSLYEEEVRVPLLLRLPGGSAAAPGGAVTLLDGDVTLLDVAPTLLALAGAPPASLPRAEGRSLLPLLAAAAPPRRPAVAVAGTWSALVAGRHKLLRDAVTGELRLYDLAADPGERHDLAATRTALAERLERRLPSAPGTSAASAEHLERLRALGYLR